MKTLPALAALLLLAGPAAAQSLGEKTGVNATLGVTPKTEDFVGEVASSDMFEIASSKLALTRADARTKAFAQRMIDDHTQTSAELKAVAAKGNFTVPTALLGNEQTMLDALKGLQGNDFTRQYHKDQVTAHKNAVSLFERYAKSGDDEGLKTFAGKALPTLQDHLKQAQDLDR